MHSIRRAHGVFVALATMFLALAVALPAAADEGRVVQAPPGQVATSHASGDETVIQSCYGGAVSVAFVDNAVFGPYTTTSRCYDINMRTTNGTYTWACVVFVDHTSDCNYWTLVGPTWTTIATSVLDGTHFKVPVWSYYVGGYVTAQIAF